VQSMRTAGDNAYCARDVCGTRFQSRYRIVLGLTDSYLVGLLVTPCEKKNGEKCKRGSHNS